MFVAGLIAGAMNAAAGGGSFVTFPAMVYAGVPSVEANASSTVALFPGSMASVIAYRNDFKAFELISLRRMLMLSVAGGLIGALLLLLTPSKTFDAIVPWLLLTGTLTFAFGGRVGTWLRARVHIGRSTMSVCQFLLGIYAGYFGGGVGIMMIAVWTLFGMTDIKAINATKTLLVGSANSIAVVCFVAANKVWWPQTCVMLVAAVIGGYGGARLARSLPPHRLRTGISCFNFLITAVFFWRTYAASGA